MVLWFLIDIVTCPYKFINAGSLRSQRRHNDHSVKQQNYVVNFVVLRELCDLQLPSEQKYL